MLAPIKNRKEMPKSLNNNQNDLNIKVNKLKLSNLKKINQKFSFQTPIHSSILNQPNKKVNFNINTTDQDNSNLFPQKNIFSSGFQNKSKFTLYNKNKSLSPLNQNSLHKVNSMNNILPNINSKKNLSSNQTFHNTKNNSILKIKNNFNRSFNNLNNFNINNSTLGFNTTKNKNNNKNSTNYNLSKNNSQFFLSSYNDNFAMTKNSKKKFNFSKFFYKSQNKLYPSKKIFRHYIREEERDTVIPIKYFKRGGAPKSIKELKELYKTNNVKFNRRIKELKCNSSIAYKDDFNILDYQSTLIKLLSNRISEKNLHDMQKNFVAFNEKNFGLIGPKGRFTNMAEKIKYSIPLYLYEKIKKLDIEKLVSRYNYYKRINENIKKKFKKKYEKKNKKKKNNMEYEENGEFNNNSYY